MSGRSHYQNPHQQQHDTPDQLNPTSRPSTEQHNQAMTAVQSMQAASGTELPSQHQAHSWDQLFNFGAYRMTPMSTGMIALDFPSQPVMPFYEHPDFNSVPMSAASPWSSPLSQQSATFTSPAPAPMLGQAYDFGAENLFPPQTHPSLHLPSSTPTYADMRSVSAPTALSTHTHIVPNTRRRFNVLLRAPCSLVRRPDGVPVTYLEKRREYKLNIADAHANSAGEERLRYRTSVRICFDAEEQRANALASWKMYVKSRGVQESSQSQGHVRAIEFLERETPGLSDAVVLEQAFFDGFVVNWSARSRASPKCAFGLRCNFLSTDFSSTNGIQGLMSRLVVKTEALTTEQTLPRQPECVYGQIQVFREHGTERKLANDRKRAEKISLRKRKSWQGEEPDPSAAWSSKRQKTEEGASSGSQPVRAASGENISPSIEVKGRLRAVYDYTTLSLAAEPEDDPDLHPLDAGILEVVQKLRAPLAAGQDRSGAKSLSGDDAEGPRRKPLASQSPPRAIPPVTSFAIRASSSCGCVCDLSYQPIYLIRRSAHDLTTAIALKYGIQRTLVQDLIYVTPRGLQVKLDDDVVGQISNGERLRCWFREVEEGIHRSGETDGDSGFMGSSSSVWGDGSRRYVVELRF